MLVRQGIIAAEDGAAILAGLDAVLAEIEAGAFVFKTSLEDIHMNVEARLAELIGDAAGRLPTARSRNAQVAPHVRPWTRAAVDRLPAALRDLHAALIAHAAAPADTIQPGHTLLPATQPSTFPHH